MVRVAAVIKPFKLDELRDSLNQIGVEGMTVTEVRGFGQQRGHAELYRGSEYVVDFLPKLRVELVIRDDELVKVTSAIIDACRTGKFGDGKIFVTRVSEVVRIRTGECGEEALS
ncbi:MAG TPA: P-II family nitrogen regulator [Myxococcota bacterium]|nr:P-II family nitrogen regulator [Myxococcota bacterium]